MAEDESSPEFSPVGELRRPVHNRAAAMVAAIGATLSVARGGNILALAEAGQFGDPPRVLPAGGGCGGGRKVMLEGRAEVSTDGERPTHLLVSAVGPDGADVLLVVERGERGVEPWPPAGQISGQIEFRTVRLAAGGVVAGVIVDGR